LKALKNRRAFEKSRRIDEMLFSIDYQSTH